MRVWKFKKNLLLLLFICHDIIYFIHNSAFQIAAAMCTAGRPAGHILLCTLLGNGRAFIYIIHKVAAAMWPLAMIFV